MITSPLVKSNGYRITVNEDVAPGITVELDPDGNVVLKQPDDLICLDIPAARALIEVLQELVG